jgi:UDP-N-acetylglucosamine/UDP-N-acetylgalactosamine diphosphorylase
MPTLTERHAAAVQTLAAVDQSHALKFYDELDDAQREHLLSQIEGIDWPEIARLIQSHVLNAPPLHLPTNIEPAPCYPQQPTPGAGATEQADHYRKARALGEKLIRDGNVAAFTVAGGQGTRLGWDAPKGTFPATPVTGRPLFGVLADYINKAQQKYNCTIPWYVMTSPANHQPTVDFFKENDYFGLDPKNVTHFPQAMMPAIGLSGEQRGKVLLADKHSLALSPNGHGGSLKALHSSGALSDMKSRGVTQISYTQIDNPTVHVVDPLFIGLHALDNAQMSSKMLPKTGPKEKLGNFCLADGKMTVIEYSDLPDELAFQTNPDGNLRFRAGSIAIHMIQVAFVENLSASPTGFALPFHRAEKKVPCIDLNTGEPAAPNASGGSGGANAVKFETFVFDALPLCDSSILYETDRIEEFAPIKNADTPGGPASEIAVDSPASSKQLQTERAARWLQTHGVPIPRDPDGSVNAKIEISPLTAITPDDLANTNLPKQINPGESLVI